MREIKIYAPAKLNLYLDVLDKRPDGFHNIETLFEKIDLKDEIIIREKNRGIKVSVDKKACPSGKDNIVYKAIQAISSEAGVKLKLEVRILKNIPVSAGLGGGSSDAASTLRAVNEIFELGVSRARLFSMAADLGKDVPFFMLDEPFAIGRGTGDILEPVKIDYLLRHLLVNPRVTLSTAGMYKRIDDKACRLPRRGKIEEAILGLKKKDIDLLRLSQYNAFEAALGQHEIHIKRIKGLLLDSGVDASLLSGSGPTVFCTFEDPGEAERALKKIQIHQGLNVFLAATYQGGIYGDNRGQDISKGRIEQ